MKTSLLSTIALAVLTTVSVFHSANAGSVKKTDAETLSALAQQATSADSAQSAGAIEQLRAAGPAGLDAMFRVYGERIQKQQNNAAKDAGWEQLRAALHTVGP